MQHLVQQRPGRGAHVERADPPPQRHRDELIALPILGKVESLGVSAAAAAVLYEILQNRRRKS